MPRTKCSCTCMYYWTDFVSRCGRACLLQNLPSGSCELYRAFKIMKHTVTCAQSTCMYLSAGCAVLHDRLRGHTSIHLSRDYQVACVCAYSFEYQYSYLRVASNLKRTITHQPVEVGRRLGYWAPQKNSSGRVFTAQGVWKTQNFSSCPRFTAKTV